jgi:hypothetical protein
MTKFITPTLAKGTPGKTAGMVRGECAAFELVSFDLIGADFEAAAVCEVGVELRFVGGPHAGQKPGRMRWIRETEDGSATTPNVDGSWRLWLWGRGRSSAELPTNAAPDEGCAVSASDQRKLKGRIGDAWIYMTGSCATR